MENSFTTADLAKGNNTYGCYFMDPIILLHLTLTLQQSSAEAQWRTLVDRFVSKQWPLQRWGGNASSCSSQSECQSSPDRLGKKSVIVKAMILCNKKKKTVYTAVSILHWPQLATVVWPVRLKILPLQWTAMAPSAFSQMFRNFLTMESLGVLPSTKNRSWCSKPESVKRLASYIFLLRRMIVVMLWFLK